MKQPLALLTLFSVVSFTGCSTSPTPPACDQEAPIAFCDDRVDDDCDGQDEVCPSTQPSDAAPTFTCGADEPVPSSVLAFAQLPENEQVATGCVFVYQGSSGDFFLAATVEDGAFRQGPQGQSTGLCSFDYAARKHLFLTAPPVEDCDDVVFVYPDEIDNQLLSNECRKMVRNIAVRDPDFDPAIQYLPGDEEVQRRRIARFSVAEVACVGINSTTGVPYRPDEVFVSQASAPLVENLTFEARAP